MRGVVVTGCGVFVPGGANLDEFWETMRLGRSGTDTPTAIPDSRLKVAEITDTAFVERLPVNGSGLDRSAQLAVTAAALSNANISGETADLSRVAVIIGNGGAGLVTLNEQYRRLYADKSQRVHPLAVAKSMSSSTASWVSIAFGLRGPTFVIASACASGTHAIGIAAELIRSGLADVAVAGGAEAPLAEGTIRAWESMRILSPDLCRPFSKGRLGLILSEGAGMLVLEAEEHAAARGALPMARLGGFSCSADAADIFNPSEDGMAQVMREAIAKAGLSPADVDYVNAHGTGTAANDRTETRAIKTVFGSDATPPVSSTKSMTGHGLGASGGVEAVATVLSLSRGMIPPTANFVEPDPECDIDCVPLNSRPASLKAALSNSFAFGGLNASLLFTA